MLNKLKKEVYNYFTTEEISFHEISSGRSNTNYFITVGNNEYFLRTNITKISDSMFGGQLEKESKIYTILKGENITADIVHFFNDGSDLQFIITEKLSGRMLSEFDLHQKAITELLQRFQGINHHSFEFLKVYNLTQGFRELLFERFKKVHEGEHKNILSQLMDYLYNRQWNIVEELTLCHNDFRNDNIIYSGNQAKLIDLEGMVIADKYIDMVEYYVGGVFWDNFTDQKEFDFDIYTNYMNKFGYTDTQKQKYIFIMKFCSNYAWLSAHISTTEKPLSIYTETLQRNTKRYYEDIEGLLI